MERIFKIIFIALVCNAPEAHSQKLIYQDVFLGGATGAGFSTSLGFGSGSFSVHIEPGSIIRKAFLLGNRYGNATDATVSLNGINYSFNSSNEFSNNFYIQSSSIIPACAVHCLDITSDIDSSILNYNISIPNQPNPNGDKYGDFFLLIFYENPLLSIINASIILNNQNLVYINYYQISGLNPINNLNPVGLSINSDIIYYTWLNDGSYIYANNNYVGLIGGSHGVDSAWGYGSRGHFYYQSNQLYGLDDDTPDSIVNGSDALADISPYVLINDATLSLKFKWQDSLTTIENVYVSFHLSYTTPCDTFTAGISQDTLMDLGDSTHLLAYGGYKYKWQPSAGLRCDTCANTIAKPDSSTLYTCTIYNNDSCTKVLPVKVNIYNNVSVESVEGGLKISLYPNPTENNITLRHSSNSTLDFIITSIQGQELKKGMLYSGETEMDVSALSAGIYFIVIRGNGISRSLKLIKK